MRVDPEELVELKNHGSMKLRCAVVRAMLLPPTERRETTILRQTEPTVLNFKKIKNLSGALSRASAVERNKEAGLSKATLRIQDSVRAPKIPARDHGRPSSYVTFRDWVLISRWRCLPFQLASSSP
jgi:hypothetical protein